MRRTKIVCTLGPASDGPDQLRLLVAAGMNVARLNFSHGTHAEHKKRLDALRQVASEAGKSVAVLQDLSGPKIRIGKVKQGTTLEPDARLVLTSAAVPEGDEKTVCLPVPELIAACGPGSRLLLDDGLLELVVMDKTATELVTRVVTGGPLGSQKGICAPGVSLSIEAVTDKDEADVRFGLDAGVDYVALSFVRSADDVLRLRGIMQAHGRQVPIIVKIEKAEAVANLEAILEVADAAMVARGDLGIEMPMEAVPLVQKQVIHACNRLGKTVITATQMLDSMIRNPRPTRAEVTDIANAVFDGTDALMLSGETAVGAYPVAAVETMARIADTAEESEDYARILHEKQAQHGTESVTDAISEAVATIAQDTGAKAILCATTSGNTARNVSKFRPRVPIFATTTSEATFRQMALLWGVLPALAPMPENTDALVAQTIQAAQERGLVQTGDRVVVTAGTPLGVPGSTNLIKVHTIGDALQPPAAQ